MCRPTTLADREHVQIRQRAPRDRHARRLSDRHRPAQAGRRSGPAPPARTRAGPRPRADQVAALGTRSATGQPRAAATIAKYRAAIDAALEHDPGRVRLPLARSRLIGLAMLALGGHPPPARRPHRARDSPSYLLTGLGGPTRR